MIFLREVCWENGMEGQTVLKGTLWSHAPIKRRKRRGTNEYPKYIIIVLELSLFIIHVLPSVKFH